MTAIPDINLLVYAYNRDAPHHDASRAWWEDLLNSDGRVAIPWVVSLGFIRLMTHRAVLVEPIAPGRAVAHVRSWLERLNVEVLEPGPRHLEILDQLLGELRTAGNVSTDAHLAALAIEHQASIHSNDSDFGRFPGLRWHNPLRS